MTESTKKTKVESGPEKREEDKNVQAALQTHAPTAPVSVDGIDQSSTTPDQINEHQDPLEEAKKLAEENRDRWLRAVAELENFKKRGAQERSKLIKYKNEELLRDLLGICDNLDRAISHCDPSKSPAGLLEGLRLVADMLKDTISKYGVVPIEAAGKPFDPNFHEAISRAGSQDYPPNTVIEELEKGYLYHDRLLRPSKVTISS